MSYSDPIEHAGLLIHLEQDECLESPRDWDNTGTIVTWHNRCSIGDETYRGSPSDFLVALMQEREWREYRKDVPDDISEAHLNAYLDKHFVLLPVYMYDHSGQSVRCFPFSCLFDSGQIGCIYAPKDHPNYQDDAQMEQLLRGEIATLDQWMTGDIWHYLIEDSDGNTLDSCGGFYGYAYAEQEAKQAAEHCAKQLAVSFCI